MSAAEPDLTPPAETAGGEDSKDSKPQESEPQGVGLDEAFDKYAKRGWPDGEDGKTPMLDAYGLREALAMMKIVLKDGEVVDLLDSLGRSRIDFAAFVDVCRSRKGVYEEREQRKVETAAAFEAMGGEDGGKVDAQRIRDILEAFEMSEVRDQLGGGDQVTLESFSDFLRSPNEDIDLDTNLHSSGQGWLRRNVADVRDTMANGKVNARLESGHHAHKGGHHNKATAVEAEDSPSAGKGEDWHRLEWLESLQAALTAKGKADMTRRKEQHRRANTLAVQGASKRFGGGGGEGEGQEDVHGATAPARLGGGVHPEKSVEFSEFGTIKFTEEKKKSLWKI